MELKNNFDIDNKNITLNEDRSMPISVCVVCYEDPKGWILGKIARNLHEQLLCLGVASCLSRTPSDSADINYHIIYSNYVPSMRKNDVLMITHIDSPRKMSLVKLQMQTALGAICMSSQTRKRIIDQGIPEDCVDFVLPAHDGGIKPRRIRLGVFSKVHTDGRKNENRLIDICRAVAANMLIVVIMGAGWEKIVQQIKSFGVEVEYYPVFDYSKYVDLVPSLDYYLYLGFDEGSMSFIDAAAAGVSTIVTRQGYHLDAGPGLAHPIESYTDAIEILNEAIEKKLRITQSVENWTWENYAKNHLAFFLKYSRKGVERKHLASCSANNASVYHYFLLSFAYKLLTWPAAKLHTIVERIRN